MAICAAYANGGGFQPYAPFSNFNGLQTQGQYTYALFLSPSAEDGAAGTLTYIQAAVCFAVNYIVVNTSGSTSFVPNSTFTFTAYLGSNQPMSSPGIAIFTCGYDTNITTFTLIDSPQEFTIDTLPAQVGEQCNLYVSNDPLGYAAPAQLYLTADIAPLSTTETTEVFTTDADTITTADLTTTEEMITSTDEISTALSTVETETITVTSVESSTSSSVIITSSDGSSVVQSTSTIVSTDIATTSTLSDISTITTAPIVTTTLILSASPATPTAGGTVSYEVYFNPPSVQQVTLELTCNSAVIQSFDTTSSQTVQTFQVDSLAMGSCSLQASNNNYDSNIIQLTVNQQLYVATSLIG